MGFSRQEYWSGLPLPPSGDLPDPGIEPGSPSSGSGATEEGLTSRGGRHLRLPLRFGPAVLGQESQASSCLRNGTPLASRVVQGISGPLLSCVWNLWVFWTMHGGVRDHLCCAFIHRVAFKEVSGLVGYIKVRGAGNKEARKIISDG